MRSSSALLARSWAETSGAGVGASACTGATTKVTADAASTTIARANPRVLLWIIAAVPHYLRRCSTPPDVALRLAEMGRVV